MTKTELQVMLRDFRNGRISEDRLLRELSTLRFESLGFATIDHHRQLRQGFPEVIFCQGKTPSQVAEIASRIARKGDPLLATRADEKHFRAVKKKVRKATYHATSRTITANEPEEYAGAATATARRSAKKKGNISGTGSGAGRILVISAGTSDIPVAEEAAVTARMCANAVDTLYDVGVAGLHRLLAKTDLVYRANVIIVVAGMEGALPSVVGGLVDVPVIAVPTSVGYGASFGGVTALLGMLNSCASGVTVVNIDNGFGAGFAASLMNRRR